MIDPENYGKQIKNDDKHHFAAARDDKQLRYYESGIYLPYGDTRIHEIIMDVTNGGGLSKHVMNEIVNFTVWDNYVERDAFDTDPNIINMANGLYSIGNGMSPHTPEYLSLRKSPIKYDPNATCPNIDKFIREVVPEEYVQTIYEIGGYAMSSKKRLKKAFIFIGKKNSGKSVLLELLICMIGREATTHVSPVTVSNTTYGAAEYYGKMLNIVDDLGNTPIMDTGVLKSVIASAPINAQFKYAQPFDYTPNVLCVFATNDVPKVEPFDEAYASRFNMIPFPNLFEGDNANPDLIDKLTTPEELSGFFNRCMEALSSLTEQKKFTAQRTLGDSAKAYHESSNPINRFVSECCIMDNMEDRISKEELYLAYTEWSREVGILPDTPGHMTTALKQMGAVIRRVSDSRGDRYYAYCGISFRV